MPEPLFIHRGEGLDFPEYLVIRLRGDLFEIRVRGAPIPAPGEDRDDMPVLREGPTAVLTMLPRQIAVMAQELLVAAPDPSMIGKVPFVLWFDNVPQRDRFVEQARAAIPDMTETSLDDPRE